MASSSSNDNYTTSREYELRVHKIIEQEMSGITGVKELQILHNTKIKGLSGYEHQIDVAYRFTIWRTEILVFVECKQYQNKVGVGELLEFRSRIEDIKAHKGILVTSSGFQRGAVEFAKASRIALLVLREATSDREAPFSITELERKAPPNEKNEKLQELIGQLFSKVEPEKKDLPDEKFCGLVERFCKIYKTVSTGYDSRISIDNKRKAVIVRHAGVEILLGPDEMFRLQDDLIQHPNKLLKAIVLDELLTPQTPESNSRDKPSIPQ